jgi:hypothetical protein
MDKKDNRIAIIFTEQQKKFLTKESELTGNPISTIVRSAVNDYYMKKLRERTSETESINR